MGAITVPLPVKLIVAMLSGRAETLSAAAERLGRDYGPVDLASAVMPFGFTDYYRAEMGGPLLRQLVAMAPLIRPEALSAVKRATQAIEAEFASRAAPDEPARPVNLDPGYVTESKLVLASTKDFAHRIYLGDGIFAEVTLTYARGGWVGGPHTFADYASGTYDEFLGEARRRLRRQLGRKEQGR